MKDESKKFKNSAIISGILHFVLLFIFLFGTPTLFERLPKEQNIMTFEVVSISDIPNIKTQAPKPVTAEAPLPSREVKKSTASSSVKLPSKEKEKKPQDKVKPEKKEPVDKPKDPNNKAKEPAPKPQQQPKKISKPIEKPTPPASKEEDSIDSILKNLEEESQGSDAKAPARNVNNKLQGKVYSKGGEFNEESPLSITEQILVKNKIQQNWTPPIAAEQLGQVRVLLHLTFEKGGVVKSVDVVNISCPPGADSTCKLTAQSTIRAVWKASPIANLPPDRYDIWKEFNIYFDPSMIAQ